MIASLITFDCVPHQVRAAWLSGVLPLLRDAETSVSDAALDLLRDGLLVPLDRCYLPADETGASVNVNVNESPHQAVVWALLEGMTAETEAPRRRRCSHAAWRSSRSCSGSLPPRQGCRRPPRRRRRRRRRDVDADECATSRRPLRALVDRRRAEQALRGEERRRGCLLLLLSLLPARRAADLALLRRGRSPQPRGGRARGDVRAACAHLACQARRARRGCRTRCGGERRERCVRELTAPPELMAPLVQACATMKPNATEWARPLMV